MKLEELAEKAKGLPDTPGVYVMKNSDGKEIYVGKAKCLKRRVLSYFQKTGHTTKTIALVENICDFDYILTQTELEAFLLESRLIKDLQPRYNIMLKHNEMYPYIEVTLGEDFPRVFVTRKKNNPKSRYFGPFVGAGDLKAAMNQLQRIFRFRICARELIAGDKRLRGQRGCLNYHIGRCAGCCRGGDGKEEYRKRIASLCRFLSGQKKELVDELREQMHAAAAALRFEEAAALRDLTEALENINNYPAFDESLAPMAPVIQPEKGLQKLSEALGLDFTPRSMEGIDIANLQGQETVGSLVSFLDGQPFKDGYRRFRIKTVEGQDDFACIHEVVSRRYGKLVQERQPLPDLIMIDGGKGQLAAAGEALTALLTAAENAPRRPVLISLAKKEELIFREGYVEPVRLSKRNEALRLLMHIRDEAHRFAQHYHHILRRKAVFGEE